jgi:exopolysaccharide biosynthesis polyprenyl glycosylphosphotransferase
MIRHQLTAKKQIFIGVLFIIAVVLMGSLKYVFGATGILLLTAEARLEVYLIGVLAALLYLHERWAELLQGSVLRAPFESALLAARFAFVQGVTFILIYFLLQDIATSRAFLIWFLVIGLPFNIILIIWLPAWLRKVFNRSGSRSAMLVGKGAIPQEVINYTERCRHFGVDFCVYYGDSQEPALGFTRQGSLADMKNASPSSIPSVKRVLFFGRDLENPEYLSALDLCHRLGLRVQVMLHEEALFGNLARHVVDGDAHFITFADEPLQNPLNRMVKRCVDIALSLFVILFLLPPLILLVWLAQRRQSPGPLFYRQTRHGLDRKTFPIFKFRTMDCSAGAESIQATVADPRVYPFGRLLRRMSLDEFPQFINVLRGEMSVIGPRPHLKVHDELFEQEINAYRIRHFVKPGITGYAQIRGFRGEVTSPEDIHNRVRHDIYYISNWSLKLDFYIACKTCVALLRPPGSAF